MTADDLKSYQAVIRSAGARQLSRLRHRVDAAAVVRRHRAAGDAEHPRRVSDGRHEAGLRALAASDDRGDEARLRRSRALSRRSRLRQRADQYPDHQGIRRQAARQHRSRSRHARRRRAVGEAAARRRQHHALLGRRFQRQCRQQHLHAELPLWRRPGRRRHRRAAQQRARRFHRGARRLQRLRPGRLRGQSARPRQAAAVLDVADHRAEGRQAGAGDRHARRQPHHFGGAADRRQRAGLQDGCRRRRGRPARAPSMDAGRGARGARVSRGNAGRAAEPKAIA